MSFGVVAAGVAVVGAGIKIGHGISQNKKASALEKANIRPDYVIPDQFKQNYALAKQMAQVGMPQQQYNNQLNNINQNQAGAVQALSRSANPGAGLASIVRGGDAATNNLNAQDAMARQNNQRYAAQQGDLLAGQELAKQQSDKFDKYTENYNRVAALRGSANQNISSGAGDLVGVGSSAFSGGSSMFSKGGGTQTMGQANGISDLPAATGMGVNTSNQSYYNPFGSTFNKW